MSEEKTVDQLVAEQEAEGKAQSPETPTTVKDGDPTDQSEETYKEDNEKFLEELDAALHKARDIVIDLFGKKKVCPGCYHEALRAIESAADTLEYQHGIITEYDSIISFLEDQLTDLEGRFEDLKEELKGSDGVIQDVVDALGVR